MLKGKIVLVTGANQGIGNEIAKVFLENHATVIANYREKRGGIDELMKDYSSLTAIKADVSNSEEVKKMFLEIKNKFKKLDILINNAGVLKDNLIMMVSEREWDNIINTNLKGCFLCMQNACKLMMSRGGSIINISSIVGKYGNKGQSAYSASKAGVIGLTLSASKELGQFNIRVNAIAPGLIKTRMIEHLKADYIDSLINKSPLKRLGLPKDIANSALFLASDISEFITGQIIEVNGGLNL